MPIAQLLKRDFDVNLPRSSLRFFFFFFFFFGFQRKVLVTGACGFVASNLIDQLLKRGYQVRGCDIVPARRSDIEFMQVDLRDLAKLTQACEGCDTVFHTAAALYKGTAELITSVNVNGTKNVIDACAAAGSRSAVALLFSSGCF
jgi:nucleoside-diphosphate-sugar epimerase